MQKTSSLKACIRGLIQESQVIKEAPGMAPEVDHPKPAFELIDPVSMGKLPSNYYLNREFPLRMNEQLVQAFALVPEDVADLNQTGGILEGEYEMSIDVDVYYTPGERSRNRWTQPDDPEEFLVENYIVKGFYGPRGQHILLSKEDGVRLAEYLGELTEDEVDRVRETYMENLPEPDFDDYEPSY